MIGRFLLGLLGDLFTALTLGWLVMLFLPFIGLPAIGYWTTAGAVALVMFVAGVQDVRNEVADW